MPIVRLIHPVVNINGTSREYLLEQYHEAALAVEAAKKALAGLVHERDYPNGTYRIAADDMTARVWELHDIQTDLYCIAEHIATN